jgi:hypothetical protein
MMENKLTNEQILCRIKGNDKTLTVLRVGNSNDNCYTFTSGFSLLGKFIAKNTQLSILDVSLYDRHGTALEIADRDFFDALRNNTSICDLHLRSNDDRRYVISDVGYQILIAYQENCSSLTSLTIQSIDASNDNGDLFIATVRSCIYLTRIAFRRCNVSNNMLLPIVGTLRRSNLLTQLFLSGNRIGDIGCRAIAQLLEDSSNNLQSLGLSFNDIGNAGAKILFDSLRNNKKLKELHLFGNPIDENVQDDISRVLCSPLNINSTYSSNHVLEILTVPYQCCEQLAYLLELNKTGDKKHVAMKKILKYHPMFDIEPLFKWDSKVELSVKGLPYIVAWFERALQSVSNEEGGCKNVEQRKLSAIYQFALAVPLHFVPILPTKPIILLYWGQCHRIQELKSQVQALKDQYKCKERGI